jgi:two-component system cell cycle response regulator
MQGYAVTVAADPATGAHLALSDPPAIVVADLWMPGISGVQLCRLLRSEPATESVPILLRGPDQSLRDRFWAERAGAVAYVGSGRMGDLVRALLRAIAASPPQENAFFTQLSGGELDLRDRIASHLDAALFESVIASEVRALGVCGTFVRLFDLLSQFVAQVTSYRWLAVHDAVTGRLALHAHPGARLRAEVEARLALGAPDLPLLAVEDEDAAEEYEGPPARIEPICLGTERLGHIALAPRQALDPDPELLRIVGRELGGPLRIAALMEQSERLALIDPLTGLMNRRAFCRSARHELDRMARTGDPVCLLLLDVDHFKSINDRRGHPTGDRVLAALGSVLPQAVRRTDLVGRWGGEEFVIVLTAATLPDALVRAEAVRGSIAAMTVYDERGETVPVTASIGVAVGRTGEDVERLVDRADRAMYAAKQGGRNRVQAELAPVQSETGPQQDKGCA